MNYFFILFILVSNAWGKDLISSSPSFDSDPIHLDYQKKIKEFESEYDSIKKAIEDAKVRVAELDFTPKVADLIKSELFTQEKYLTLIDQEISYYKLKDIQRNQYYSTLKTNITSKIVEEDFKKYELAEKANPKKYIWRSRPPFTLPPRAEKRDITPKKEDPSNSKH